MTRPPAQQLQTCCTVVSSPWSSRASVAPGMKYLLISCSVTSAPHWIPLWLLGCSLLDVDVIRVMSCVLCCRAECGHTQESCSHHDFVMTSSTFRNGKTIWRVVKHLCLRAGADPLWYSEHPNIISLHVMYKKSTICIQILLWFIIFPFYFDVALLLMLCCVIMMCYVSIAQILPLTMMVATTDERFSERSRHRVI